MPTNLTEAAVYTGPISHPDPGDLASGTQLRTGVSQVLADRTRFLLIDAVGARVASMVAKELTVTTDDVTAVFAGEQYSLMAGVACGDGGRIWTSQDGETWTARTAGGGFTGGFGAGCLAASGRSVIVGTDEIQTSDNASTWTSRALGAGFGGTSTILRAVAHSGAVLIAVGAEFTSPSTYAGAIQRSVDNGVTWTRVVAPALATDYMFWDVIYTGSRFIATAAALPGGGSTIEVWSSVDGSAGTWSKLGTITSDGGYYPQIAQGADGRLVVSGFAGMYYSDDIGASWTLVTVVGFDGTDRVMSTLAFGRGVFIATEVSSVETFISDTGDEWFSVGPTLATPLPGKAAYVLGRWTTPGTDGKINRSLRSADF